MKAAPAAILKGKKMNVPVIIPTYNPTERIISVVEGLKAKGFGDIIIIDDGSSSDRAPVFERLRGISGCTVLKHEVNRGKGRGLKTGFKYVLENFGECDGVVTTDDDGQHLPEDILRCAKRMCETKTTVLGARDFGGENVPPKSRFGNNMTRFVFRFLCGIRITDTQTGLRAIPREYLGAFLSVSGERFEYETNMLLEMKRLSLMFVEEPITTVYSDNNKSTHFSPFVDSVKIYAVILKFMLSSLIASIIDILLFTALNLCLPLEENLRVFAATAGARIVSSAMNYLVNKKKVFRSEQPVKRTIVRYYILCAAQLLASFVLVNGLSMLFGAEKDLLQSVIKMAVDTALFFVSFGIQREWVYK